MRFFSCQFLAYFENDLWLKNAAHANAAGAKLASIFQKHQLKLEYPVEANEIHAIVIRQPFFIKLINLSLGY